LINHRAVDACPSFSLNKEVGVLIILLLDIFEADRGEAGLDLVDNFAEVSLHGVFQGVHFQLIIEENLSQVLSAARGVDLERMLGFFLGLYDFRLDIVSPVFLV
jgi:hypothetical protein